MSQQHSLTRHTNRFEGGDLVVKSLIGLGVKQIFSVSGGPLNSIYHACAVHGLPLRHTRHEAAACFMAEAVTRITGTPGVAAVTLGPGTANAVTSSLVAKMASVPLLIIGAQASTRSFDKGAGMSADHVAIMAPVTKWSARVLHTERIPEYIEMAWRKMWSGSPGPVFLEIPSDILCAPANETQRRFIAERPSVGLSRAGLAGLAEAAGSARKPLLIIGDDVRWQPPVDMAGFVERNRLPFVTLRLARGAIDERHPNCIGPGYCPCNETLRRALAETDFVLLLGHSFEFDLDYGKTIAAGATLVQSTLDPEILGKNRAVDFGLICSPADLLGALGDVAFPSADFRWVRALSGAWRAERSAQRDGVATGPLHPIDAVDAVVEASPPDTVFVTSHGNVDFWADARLQVRSPDLYLRAGQAGALGTEIPYGIGARFANPDRPVVVFVGDGGVGFHVAELDTAARYGRPVTVVVLDDQKWGAIALPQQQSCGGEFEMDLPKRDWGKVAEGLGGIGLRAGTAAELVGAVRRSLAESRPTLIQVDVRSVLSPYMAYISK